MKISLYELFGLCNLDSVDIADNTYDFAVNFACNLDKNKCKDYYDKLMRMFAIGIECGNFEIWSSPVAHCDIVAFIRQHYTSFNVFMSHNNRDGYKPQEYDLVEEDTDLWYDLYMNTFESLVIGNYSDEQYKELYQLMGGK